MFLLVTGASGAGKSTVRELVADDLAAEIQCVELGHVVSIPAQPTKAWRQQATEAVVQRALILQAADRHLMLTGDPVAAGEVIAAPSAVKLEPISICLLDVNAEVQAARLAQRGDDRRLLADHQAFARWMRVHAQDPSYMRDVLSAHGWEAMRWERPSASRSRRRRVGHACARHLDAYAGRGRPPDPGLEPARTPWTSATDPRRGADLGGLFEHRHLRLERSGKRASL